MKILVCGTRGHTSDAEYAEFKNAIDEFYDLTWSWDVEVIHGACPDSPDEFGDRLKAEFPSIDVTAFPADWSKGHGAGFARNKQMVEEAPDVTIAVWDGYSNGTKDTIIRSVRGGIPVRIVPVDELPEHTAKRQGR